MIRNTLGNVPTQYKNTSNESVNFLVCYVNICKYRHDSNEFWQLIKFHYKTNSIFISRMRLVKTTAKNKNYFIHGFFDDVLKEQIINSSYIWEFEYFVQSVIIFFKVAEGFNQSINCLELNCVYFSPVSL